MSLAYPLPEQAIPEVAALVGMLTGKATPDTAQALHSGWVVQGYLMSLVVGHAEAAAVEAEALDDAGAVEKLSSLLEVQAQDASGQGLAGGIGGAMAARLLLPIIQKWLVQWLQNGGLEQLIGQITGGKTA